MADGNLTDPVGGWKASHGKWNSQVLKMIGYCQVKWEERAFKVEEVTWAPVSNCTECMRKYRATVLLEFKAKNGKQ